MGGDALSFKAKRLTDAQFRNVVKEVLELVQKLFLKIEVYIPMPEKQTHGDVDFLTIPDKNLDRKLIPQLIGSKEFVSDHRGGTMNCEYKGFQVDFKFVESETEFNMARFYKSYSGVGSVLGYFTHCQNLTLTESGLYAVKFVTPTIKLKHLVSDDPKVILKLYGLDPNTYSQGFKTRDLLCSYLASCRFYDFQRVIKGDQKHISKLLTALKDWSIKLPQDSALRNKTTLNMNYCQIILAQSNQKAAYEHMISCKLQQLQRHKTVKDRFNGKHMMEMFDLKPNQLNAVKKKFRDHFSSEQAYEDFILTYSLQEIAEAFKKIALTQGN